MKNLTVCLCALLCTSCALNRPIFRECITSTNGTVTVRELRVTTLAFWPATTQLERQRASLGKTFSLGTTGLHEETLTTNFSNLLEAVAAGAVRGAVSALPKP